MQRHQGYLRIGLVLVCIARESGVVQELAQRLAAFFGVVRRIR